MLKRRASVAYLLLSHKLIIVMTFKTIIYVDYSAENPFEPFVQPLHIFYDKN